LNYRPHVSFGYFANKDLARSAAPMVEKLNEILTDELDGMTLDFTSASLYGMEDMQTLYRKSVR